MPGPLEERLIALGWQAEWFDASEADIEARTRDFLRKLAVDYLRGDSTLAKAFQAGFHTEKAWQGELASQAKTGVWADEAHFMALASCIGFHSKAYKTVYGPGPSRIEPLSELLNHTCLDSHGQIDTQKPILHLVNSGGHWHRKDYPSGSTQGGGNCLYNACGQELQRLVTAERKQLHEDTSHEANRAGARPASMTTASVAVNTTAPKARLSPSTIVHDFEAIDAHRPPQKPHPLKQAVLDSATALHFEYNRLERQLTDTRRKELNTIYTTLERSAPCRAHDVTSANRVDPSAQVHQDYLLALRLQLEEIDLYRKCCAPQ